MNFPRKISPEEYSSQFEKIQFLQFYPRLDYFLFCYNSQVFPMANVNPYNMSQRISINFSSNIQIGIADKQTSTNQSSKYDCQFTNFPTLSLSMPSTNPQNAHGSTLGLPSNLLSTKVRNPPFTLKNALLAIINYKEECKRLEMMDPKSRFELASRNLHLKKKTIDDFQMNIRLGIHFKMIHSCDLIQSFGIFRKAVKKAKQITKEKWIKFKDLDVEDFFLSLK